MFRKMSKLKTDKNSQNEGTHQDPKWLKTIHTLNISLDIAKYKKKER